MDKLILRGLEFQARHGVLPEEKDTDQPFIVDAVLHLDLKAAAAADDLRLGLDYGEVFVTIRKVVEGGSFNLIEALAERIAGEVLSRHPVQAVDITVKKPRAPIPGRFEYVAVEIHRKK